MKSCVLNFAIKFESTIPRINHNTSQNLLQKIFSPIFFQAQAVYIILKSIKWFRFKNKIYLFSNKIDCNFVIFMTPKKYIWESPPHTHTHKQVNRVALISTVWWYWQAWCESLSWKYLLWGLRNDRPSSESVMFYFCAMIAFVFTEAIGTVF